MIRSKGEAGTGNIVEAVRHLRSILGRPAGHHAGRLGRAVRLGQGARRADRAGAGDRTRPGSCRCRCSAPAGSPRRRTRRWSCSSVPRPCSSGSGIFKSSDPARMASAIVEATAHFKDADHVAKVSRGLGRGDARAGGVAVRRASRRPGVVAGRLPRRRARAGAADRRPRPAGRRPRARRGAGRGGCPARLGQAPGDLDGLDGLVLPGGESTTLSMLLESTGLFDAVAERLGRVGSAGPRHLRRAGPRGAGGARRAARPAHLRCARCRRPPQRLRPPARSRSRARCASAPARGRRCRPSSSGRPWWCRWGTGSRCWPRWTASRCWCARARCWPRRSTPS